MWAKQMYTFFLIACAPLDLALKCVQVLKKEVLFAAVLYTPASGDADDWGFVCTCVLVAADCMSHMEELASEWHRYFPMGCTLKGIYSLIFVC